MMSKVTSLKRVNVASRQLLKGMSRDAKCNPTKNHSKYDSYVIRYHLPVEMQHKVSDKSHKAFKKLQLYSVMS